MICAEKGRADVVDLLLGAGAAVAAVNKARRGAVEGRAIGLLSTLPASSSPSQDGRTALHLAAMAGGGPGGATVDRLLRAGAGREAADVDGNTPLLLAARYGRLDACRYEPEGEGSQGVASGWVGWGVGG